MLAHFLEIHPRQRIAYAYTMLADSVLMSSSLVEFDGVESKTRMTFTEQALFGSAFDGDIREHGTGIGFTRLHEAMAETLQVGNRQRAASGYN